MKCRCKGDVESVVALEKLCGDPPNREEDVVSEMTECDWACFSKDFSEDMKLAAEQREAEADKLATSDIDPVSYLEGVIVKFGAEDVSVEEFLEQLLLALVLLKRWRAAP